MSSFAAADPYIVSKAHRPYAGNVGGTGMASPPMWSSPTARANSQTLVHSTGKRPGAPSRPTADGLIGAPRPERQPGRSAGSCRLHYAAAKPRAQPSAGLCTALAVRERTLAARPALAARLDRSAGR